MFFFELIKMYMSCNSIAGGGKESNVIYSKPTRLLAVLTNQPCDRFVHVSSFTAKSYYSPGGAAVSLRVDDVLWLLYYRFICYVLDEKIASFMIVIDTCNWCLIDKHININCSYISVMIMAPSTGYLYVNRLMQRQGIAQSNTTSKHQCVVLLRKQITFFGISPSTWNRPVLVSEKIIVSMVTKCMTSLTWPVCCDAYVDRVRRGYRLDGPTGHAFVYMKWYLTCTVSYPDCTLPFQMCTYHNCN